ncbi:molybdenum cofactor biosynthesis protein B [Conexibacter sp. SYSU D00693]|uniref:MogA/MoaB family molybdenum cofactor biosynthesis protein n=1 Tax=Conexibacter sp. SYSU D00693 TaxID=2812560 RepID=UPI00196AE093|nr:MogA/MoaB family molybdenum cofactor biosynthesis protein [Conexibacter sp. SYSU D00693]
MSAPRTAVLTVSTTVARGDAQDGGGPRLAELARDAGCEVAATDVVRDDRAAISARIASWVSEGLDVVLTTGGTGLTPDDVTPEATADVVEREVPGIQEAFRAASLQHTPMGVLSRGVAGVAGRTLVVNLPGNPKALDQLFPILAPVLGHAVGTIRGRGDHGRHPGA